MQNSYTLPMKMQQTYFDSASDTIYLIFFFDMIPSIFLGIKYFGSLRLDKVQIHFYQ